MSISVSAKLDGNVAKLDQLLALLGGQGAATSDQKLSSTSVDIYPTERKTEEAVDNEDVASEINYLAPKPVPPPNLQTQSPFMKLPLELRLQIYKLVSVSEQPITNPHEQLEFYRNDAVDRIPDIFSSIVMTCKLIGKEARSVLDGENLFIFTHPKNVRLFRTRDTTTGLEDLPIPASRIRKVRLLFAKPGRAVTRRKSLAAEAKVWVDDLFSWNRVLVPMAGYGSIPSAGARTRLFALGTGHGRRLLTLPGQT